MFSFIILLLLSILYSFLFNKLSEIYFFLKTSSFMVELIFSDLDLCFNLSI